MLNQFKTTFLPLGFAIDAKGKIVSSHAFNNMESFKKLLASLHQVS